MNRRMAARGSIGIDLYAPNPPGAGRAKLIEEPPEKQEGTNRPPRFMRQPKTQPPVGPGLILILLCRCFDSLTFFALMLDLFTGMFQNVDDWGLPLVCILSHFGFNYAHPFRT